MTPSLPPPRTVIGRRRFLGLAVGAAVAGPMVVAACSSGSSSDRAATRRADGILRIGVAGAPSNINPLDSGSELTQWIAEPVMESLYTYDEDLASVARDRFGLEVATGMFDATSFDGDEFDLAYSCHVWEHLADPVATSTAVHALLAPREGYLVIVVPTFRRARTLAWSCFTAPHTYMFTEVSLRNVLVRAGFDIVDHRFHSGADSELWLVARARRRGIPAEHPVVEEDLGTVQRELARVVWRAPLGTPARVATHVRTLLGDPLDFARRGTRWCGRRIERLKRTAGR